MITDALKNIGKYSGIPVEIRNFIKTISKELPIGRIELDGENYANVEEYITKTHDKCRFEAHKKYADIQIILSGTERLDFSCEKEAITEPYDDVRDVMFAEAKESASVVLDGTNFVLYLPEELHRPQMCIDAPQSVKKIVVKVRY